jgi:hypothetical protein
MLRALVILMALAVATPDPLWAQAIQHGAQPNPQEVRPGNAQGDSPSAAVGQVQREAEPEWLGLPRYALATIGVSLALLVGVAWLLRSARRRP